MDIRNIKEEAPKVGNHQLEKLYELQKDLMKDYLRIEGLPDYPIEINSRKGQVVLKDMSARVIEEMGEGYESTGYALEILDRYGFNPLSIQDKKPDDWKMILNHLQNSNEEQADAIAFYLELLIYSNVGPEDIYDYVENIIAKKYPISSNNFERDMQHLMDLGYILLEKRFGYEYGLLDNALYRVISSSYIGEEYLKVHSYTPGFNNLSWEFHDTEAKLCWEVSYHLSVARNFLKNKPWKQSGEMTDEQAYQSEIVLGFIEYLGYLKFVGMTAESAYELRFKKHMVNKFRIRSNY